MTCFAVSDKQKLKTLSRFRLSLLKLLYTQYKENGRLIYKITDNEFHSNGQW